MYKKAWCTCKALFCLLNLLFFWRSRCRPRLWILKSLLGSFSNDEGDENVKKKKIGSDKQKNNSKCPSHFFNIYFFAVTARLPRESASLHVLRRTWTRDDEFFFLFLNLSAVPKKSTRGKFAYTWRIQKTGITDQSLKKHKFVLKVRFSLPSP